jgi:hypothetical protein
MAAAPENRLSPNMTSRQLANLLRKVADQVDAAATTRGSRAGHSTVAPMGDLDVLAFVSFEGKMGPGGGVMLVGPQ